jgi:hypothetical protein
MVFANRTYLDSLNRYIVLRYYKALLGISERSLVSTEPFFSISLCITEEVYEDDLYGLTNPNLTLKPHEAWKKQEGGAKFKTDDKSERIERLFAPNPILNPAK